jgi:catechol 2,3-dioxygenase-like lactoylglutathione lyase family enzyme
MATAMRIGQIELFVADPILSAVFWRSTLGFRIIDVESDDLVRIDCGGVEVVLRRGRPTRVAVSYRDATDALVLYTDDLDAAAARLCEAGVLFEGNDGSDSSLTFRDPDGNWLRMECEE